MNPISFKHHRFPPDAIRLTVWHGVRMFMLDRNPSYSQQFIKRSSPRRLEVEDI